MKKILIALLALSFLITGCFHAKIINGKSPGRTPIKYDEKWHSGFFWGMAEVSGPYDLDEICPNGWAEVKTHTSFLNGFVQVLAGFWFVSIYNPQTTSIQCAAVAPKPKKESSGINEEESGW